MNNEMLTDSSPAPLISSTKVEGTSVFRSNGEKIGWIEKVVINKQSGHVAFAVMACGGALAGWKEQIPLPWDVLRFNSQMNGYELDLSEEQLGNASRFASGCELDWDEPDTFLKVEGWFKGAITPRFDQAKQDVGKIFGAPEDVYSASDLSKEQKIFLLRQWETDLRLLMVASDESMASTTPGRTADLLQQVRQTLTCLGAADTEPTAVN